jgi:hypothetical protein
MRAHVVQFGTLPRTWPGLTLREKRVRLVEEQLGALAVEARLLGIGYTELAERLRRFYEEES